MRTAIIQGNEFQGAGRRPADDHLHPEDGGEPIQHVVTNYPADGGVALGMFNFNDSIADFARASFSYGLERGYPVYLSDQEHDLEGVRRRVQGHLRGRSLRTSTRLISRLPGDV
jgi:hypothetical protein